MKNILKSFIKFMKFKKTDSSILASRKYGTDGKYSVPDDISLLAKRKYGQNQNNIF